MSELVIAWPGGSLDLLRGRVLRHGQPVEVEPRAWRVLEQLARLRHRVVTKEELLTALRPEGTVSDGALRQAVRAARQALGDDGDRPIIRSVPRVGYIFEVPAASAPQPRTAGSTHDGIASLIIGPLRHSTGRAGLQWAAHGLVGCIAHGLSIGGRLQVQDTQALEASWPADDAQLVQMLRAAGARYAVVGSLGLAGREFTLELQLHDRDRKTVVAVRAAAAAGLVLPAIEAVEQALLGAGEPGTAASGLRGCSPWSLELFARARHAAAMHRHAAALRALALLQQLEPGFPRLDLELLRAQAVCGDDAAPGNATRLLELAQRDQDRALEAQVRHCLGTMHHVKGELRESARSLEHALALGRGAMPLHWQGYTLTLLASVECRLGELHSVAKRLDEAQTLFTRMGSRWGLLTVLWLRAIMSSLSGHAEQSIRWNRKLANAARRLHANTALVSVCLNLAGELIHADRLDEAREHAEEATATALAIEADAGLLGTVANVHCLLHRQQGRPDAAAELLSLLPSPDQGGETGYLWQAHGHAAMAADRIDAAADCFVRAAAECRRQGNRVAEPLLLPWLVESLVRSGRLSDAQAELDRAENHAHLQDEVTTANLLYPRMLLARRRRQEPEAQALLAQLASAPAALPLFRRLAQDLAATPAGPKPAPPTPVVPPNGQMRRQYRFAHCVLDVERREFWVDGRRQPIAPKPFDVLVHLFANRHRVVTQDELLDVVWRKAAASPELIAQAIATIRRAMRRGRNPGVRIQTVYRQGYRLLAEPHVATEDDTAATLLSDPHAAPPRPLALVPLPGGERGAGVSEAELGYPLEVFGYTVALYARFKRMSAAEVQASVDGAGAASPEAIADAIGVRSPGAHVLFARLGRRDGGVSLTYRLVSPEGCSEGSLHDRSPTALGRRLAARLLSLEGEPERARATGTDEDDWTRQMLDLALRAAEERRWSMALRILDVVIDQDSDHALAADLRTRIVDAIAAA